MFKYDFSLSHCGSSLSVCLLYLLDCQTPVKSTYYSSITSSFFFHHHLISYLPQYDTSAYPECHFLLLHLHQYLYLSIDENLDFYQYLLVSHPVLSDQSSYHNQSTHLKYLLHRRCCFCIHITHLNFIQSFYLLLVVHSCQIYIRENNFFLFLIIKL